MIEYLYKYLLFINILSFSTMAYDKWQAVGGRWRIKEATLFLFAFLGGALAMFVAMRVFRHKTQKPLFAMGIPLLVIFNIAFFYFFLN